MYHGIWWKPISWHFSDLPRGISSIEAPANDGWILWDRWDARGWEYHGNDTSKMCKLVSFMMMLNMVLTFWMFHLLQNLETACHSEIDATSQKVFDACNGKI
jgi:hypothetical protein